MCFLVDKGGELVFQGTTALSLDVKGRLAIPARHREALVSVSGGRLVLTAHPGEFCLLLYPESAWEPIRDQVLAASSLNPRSAAIKRRLVGNARDEELDSAGRLLICSELRDIAQLEKQVWLVGQGKGFEIWSDANWRQQQEKLIDMAGLPSELEDLPL
jgi:MraZ protein